MELKICAVAGGWSTHNDKVENLRVRSEERSEDTKRPARFASFRNTVS